MYAIGNDHSAVALKEVIKAHLESKGIEVKDFGTESTTASNYAAKAEEVAAEIERLIDTEEFKVAGEAKVEETEQKTKWVCEVCGHVHYGDNPPDTCPLCGVPSKMFKKVE